MAYDLNKLWSKLTLTNEENVDLCVEKSWVEDTLKESKNCLVGKILSRKVVNLEEMKYVLTKVWKLKSDLLLREIGEKIFIFQFENLLGKNRIYLSQPWTFNKALIVLQEYDGITPIKKLRLCWCPFWVQIHSLPLCLMNEKVGVVLGESLGDVEKVETLFGNKALGQFMRVRVLINIHKPLKRVDRVTMNDHEPILVSYKYERLLDFCFICGFLNHHESECDHAIAMKKNVGVISKEHGAWMRTDG
ncbi:hypothetical protein REPUB_Repub02eG0199500 [Reevesia pubescens]